MTNPLPCGGSRTWAQSAQHFIDATMKEMPTDATIADRQKRLREVRGRFVGGTSWGAKIWPRECKRYLQAHYGGQVAVRQKRVEDSPLFGPDITFPFRS